MKDHFEVTFVYCCVNDWTRKNSKLLQETIKTVELLDWI